jgi:H+/Cl- antiporter ClcA
MNQQARTYLLVLLAAALLGVPVALVATLYTSLTHALTTVFWTDFPHDMGFSEPPWWYVLLLPTFAGLCTAGALRLPGRGGHSPADGLSFEPQGPKLAASGILAATASLVFGIVLGPEAPLTAIGLSMGMVAGRMVSQNRVPAAIVALAGAFAAIATVFGGPLPSSLLLFESVASSGAFASAMLPRILLPGFLAAGVGELIFTGVAHWSGVHQAKFTVPNLPHYGSVRVADIGIALLIAIVTAVVVVVARRAGSEAFKRVGGRLPVLLGGGLAVGLIAVIFHEVSGDALSLVLFSGETALGTVVTVTSVSVLIGVLVAKALAYAISIGAGFRGGPVFPSLFVGVAVGVLAHSLDSSFSVTAGIAVGVAASGASALRAPFFGALMASLLVGTAGVNTIPLAIIGAVVAWLIAMAASRKDRPEAPVGDGQAPAAAAPGPPAAAPTAAAAGPHAPDTPASSS